MAKVFIEETTLTAIGDAIRGKEGSTELVPVNDMATRITSLPSGGGGTDVEPIVLTGDCSSACRGRVASVFIETFPDKITTKDITDATSMFHNSTLKAVPFQINVSNPYELDYMFSYAQDLTVCPKIRGTFQWLSYTTLASLLGGAKKLRDVEDLFTTEMLEGFSTVKITSAYSAPKPTNFEYMFSLRRLPTWFYLFKLSPESTVLPSYSNTLYYSMLNQCSVLDEALDIPVWAGQGTQTSNMFYNTFSRTERLKKVTFETNEGNTPIVAKWKSQIIDLSDSVGYSFFSIYNITDYNSGITTDKQVTDDATYQALKNDPDWFTAKVEYCRYNHDSAVETINSLPDTSAYLTTAGGTNTIKFKKAAGSATDGGAIENLTAEEIAVAAAKGWTVTLV